MWQFPIQCMAFSCLQLLLALSFFSLKKTGNFQYSFSNSPKNMVFLGTLIQQFMFLCFQLQISQVQSCTMFIWVPVQESSQSRAQQPVHQSVQTKEQAIVPFSWLSQKVTGYFSLFEPTEQTNTTCFDGVSLTQHRTFSWVLTRSPTPTVFRNELLTQRNLFHTHTFQ